MEHAHTTNCSVLIVEDDADIRDALSQILEEEGLLVLGASNGLEALERLRGGYRADIILLDLMMPVMNGWQFRQEQLRDPQLAHVPVIVISADGAAGREAAAMGSQGFLQKPIELDELLALVTRWCGRQADGTLRPPAASTPDV